MHMHGLSSVVSNFIINRRDSQDSPGRGRGDVRGVANRGNAAPRSVNQESQSSGASRELNRKQNDRCQVIRQGGGDKKVIKLIMPGSGHVQWKSQAKAGKFFRNVLNMGFLRNRKQKVFQKSKQVAAAPGGGRDGLGQAGKGGYRKAEFLIAGPQAMKGILDRGANSISKNISSANALVSMEVNKAKRAGDNEPIVLIKGHSRNGVAASQVATQTVERLKNEGVANPHVEVVLFDPVPGPGHRGKNIAHDISTTKQSTVVYSKHTQHHFGFKPQLIKGASAVVISDQNHGVGTKSLFEFDGQIYKGSGLNGLGAGVYVGSELKKMEDGTVVEVLERVDAEKAVKDLQDFNKEKYTQHSRRGVIIDAVNAMKRTG